METTIQTMAYSLDSDRQQEFLFDIKIRISSQKIKTKIKIKVIRGLFDMFDKTIDYQNY